MLVWNSWRLRRSLLLEINHKTSSVHFCLVLVMKSSSVKIKQLSSFPYCGIWDFPCDHSEEGLRTAPGVPTCSIPPLWVRVPRPPTVFSVSLVVLKYPVTSEHRAWTATTWSRPRPFGIRPAAHTGEERLSLTFPLLPLRGLCGSAAVKKPARSTLTCPLLWSLSSIYDTHTEAGGGTFPPPAAKN